MNETTERPHKVPRPRLSTQLAHSHCLQTLVKNADFYGRRQARQNCQLHCPLVRVFLLNHLFWLQSSGRTLSTNVSDEREIRAITLHDTPSSDCFFYSPQNKVVMKAGCFLCFGMAGPFPSIGCVQTQGAVMPREEVALAQNVKPAFNAGHDGWTRPRAAHWLVAVCSAPSAPAKCPSRRGL